MTASTVKPLPSSSFPESAASARPAWARWLALVTVLAAIALLALGGRSLLGGVPRFAEWVAAQGAWGVIAFVVGYAAAVVAFVPGSVLTLVAGALFGVVEGSIYVFAAAVLGSSLAFLLSRKVVRGAIERRIAGNPKFDAIDRAVARDGRRIVFLLRLSPAFPFTLLNYVLGLTRVSFGDYLVASVGMLPGTIAYVYYGSLAGDAAAAVSSAGPSGGSLWLKVIGVIATVLVTTLVARAAKRALAEAAV